MEGTGSTGITERAATVSKKSSPAGVPTTPVESTGRGGLNARGGEEGMAKGKGNIVGSFCAPVRGTLNRNNSAKTRTKTQARARAVETFASRAFVLGAMLAMTVALLVATSGRAHAVAPPPSAHDDSAATTKNTPVSFNVLLNDTGYYLKVTSIGNASHGSVSCQEDGECMWTPANNYVGPDGFQYTVTDSEGQRSTAFVDLFAEKDSTIPPPDDREDAPEPPGLAMGPDETAPKGTLDIFRSDRALGGRSVFLRIEASDSDTGVKTMRIANKGRGYTSWQKFDDLKIWNLTRGDGRKTVLVQLRDGAGNVRTISDSIRLDSRK